MEGVVRVALQRSEGKLKHLASIAATTIVLLFLLAASVPLLHWFEREGREALYATSQQQWQGLAIRNYRIAIRAECACEFDGTLLRIEVNDGVAGLSNGRDESKNILQMNGLRTSVDGLFGLVRNALDAEPDTIVVEYDENYGYPTRLHVDPDRSADDALLVIVEEFRVLSR